MANIHTYAEHIRHETLTDIPSQTVNNATVNGVAWLDMAKYDRAWIICMVEDMPAGAVVAFGVNEALTAAGGTPLVIAGAAVTFADTEDDNTKVIDVAATAMRMNAGYRWIRPFVTESGVQNAVCTCVVLRERAAYAQAGMPA